MFMAHSSASIGIGVEKVTLEELTNIFRSKIEEAARNRQERVDLVQCSAHAACHDLYKIGLAARWVAARYGDAVRLEMSMTDVVIVILDPDKITG